MSGKRSRRGADPKDCLRFAWFLCRRTFSKSASTSVRTVSHVLEEGSRLRLVLYPRVTESARTEEFAVRAVFGWPLVVAGSASTVDCTQCTRTVGLSCGECGSNAPRSLAVIWFYATRLETRTKESDACASLRVTETLRHNESEVRLPSHEVRSVPARFGASSTDLFCSQKGLSKSTRVGTRKMVNYA